MYLSNIELYFLPKEYFAADKIVITGDEFKHLANVMRHKSGDEIFITDGEGKIFKTVLETLVKKQAVSKIVDSYSYDKEHDKIVFCMPLLQNADRFETALEKCVELGITEFIVYEADRSFRKGDKTERWLKIAAAAMKQSLRSYLPNINYCKSIADIMKMEGDKIQFEQNSEIEFSDVLKQDNKDTSFGSNTNKFLIFGPEGGFSERELENLDGTYRVKLTNNRLRAETAVIAAASLISTI